MARRKSIYFEDFMRGFKSTLKSFEYNNYGDWDAETEMCRRYVNRVYDIIWLDMRRSGVYLAEMFASNMPGSLRLEIIDRGNPSSQYLCRAAKQAIQWYWKGS